jgi:dolichol-phosphate hexosyltransferase
VRAFDGYTSHSFLFVLGNKLVTLVANALFNVYLRDLMTCHKAVRTDLLRALPLKEAGFGIEPEITARLLQRGERIFEVPVSYQARSDEEGKKLTALDGLRVTRTLIRCRFTRG